MKLGCGLTVLALLAGAALFAWSRLAQPFAAFAPEAFVDVPRGADAFEIGARLAAAGVVRSRWDFAMARLLDRKSVLQAGEYHFDHPASVKEVMGRIVRGDTFYYPLVVPEGANMFDIAAAAAPFGVFSADDFLKAARDPASIRDLDPQAPTLEGYLFPSTYRVTRVTTAPELCRSMTTRFRAAWRKTVAAASVHDTITLASMVEKEGKLASDRPLIAAVFENRLRLDMTLDCDPTTIYAALLDNRYRGTIYRSDLESGNPYNTYRHDGLPPGPIANPGMASINAVLHPADSSALYFVALPDGSGGHAFSETRAEHEAAVARYRRGRN